MNWKAYVPAVAAFALALFFSVFKPLAVLVLVCFLMGFAIIYAVAVATLLEKPSDRGQNLDFKSVTLFIIQKTPWFRK